MGKIGPGLRKPSGLLVNTELIPELSVKNLYQS